MVSKIKFDPKDFKAFCNAIGGEYNESLDQNPETLELTETTYSCTASLHNRLLQVFIEPHRDIMTVYSAGSGGVKDDITVKVNEDISCTYENYFDRHVFVCRTNYGNDALRIVVDERRPATKGPVKVLDEVNIKVKADGVSYRHSPEWKLHD